MSFAEKKVELLKIVADADEELTGKLIEIALQYNSVESGYTAKDIEAFHATRLKYASPEAKTISLEDAHAYIRSLKQK